MDTIDNLFSNEINRAITAFPSIYSNTDVISLLENLKLKVLDEVSKTKPTTSITKEQFQEFNTNVCDRLYRTLQNDGERFVDYSSAEFTIDYSNQLSIENIDINVDSITEELDDILLNEFTACFGDLTIKNEE